MVKRIVHSPMLELTGDETADFLIRQLKCLKRIGSPAQRDAVLKWRKIVQQNATRPAEPQVVNYAMPKPEARLVAEPIEQ